MLHVLCVFIMDAYAELIPEWCPVGVVLRGSSSEHLSLFQNKALRVHVPRCLEMFAECPRRLTTSRVSTHSWHALGTWDPCRTPPAQPRLAVLCLVVFQRQALMIFVGDVVPLVQYIDVVQFTDYLDDAPVVLPRQAVRHTTSSWPLSH